MSLKANNQEHLTKLKDINIYPNNGEYTDFKKKKIIIQAQQLNEYYEGMLWDIIKQLDQFFQSINNSYNISKDDLQKFKQLMNEINKQIIKALDKIDSFEKQPKEPYENQINLKTRKCQYSQTPQNLGDTGVLQPAISSIIENKIQIEQEENKVLKEKQINQVSNKQNQQQRCLINHSYIQDHLENYQIILHLLLQQNLKNNKNSLKCFCDVNIKCSHLTTLSNKNLFDLLLNQQQDQLFLNLHKQLKVLNCTNNFCSFRCINVQINNLDRRQQKYYCLLCNEYSVA
ncbi:unnamed protein product [Paramecium pentaurelia]|uniref:Uncharacterized protein n=1 Tax=Paramecium pentaurelia TaxID=43138 RepID=A0A8S1T9P6_9CILI|nr:unnamed protein product [Paramecium pentaurelia]